MPRHLHLKLFWRAQRVTQPTSIYDKAGYFLPDALQVGEVIRIASTGAYTTSYSAIGFNGFAPLAQGYINIVAMREPAA